MGLSRNQAVKKMQPPRLRLAALMGPLSFARDDKRVIGATIL